MINIVVRVGFAVIIFLFGLFLWISGDFASALAVKGLGRFFGGLIAMAIGVAVALIRGD